MDPSPAQKKIDALMIRPMEASDADAMAAAFQAIGWTKSTEVYRGYYSEQEAGTRNVLVATIDGEFTGYVTVQWYAAYEPYKRDGLPEIEDLNVLPAYQRRGIGSALLDASESLAVGRADGVGIRVGLTAEYGAAQRLYVQRGYVPDGRGIAWKGEPVKHGAEVRADDDLTLCMRKRLKR